MGAGSGSGPGGRSGGRSGGRVGSVGGLPNHHVAIEDVNATSQPEFLGVFVPLIENVELFGGRGFKVGHALDHFDDASATGAVKATRLHIDSGGFSCLEEEFAGGDLSGELGREESDLGHVADGAGSARSGARNLCLGKWEGQGGRLERCREHWDSA